MEPLTAGDGLDQLSPKQQQAIVGLLNEPTLRRASKRSAVPERTLYNWLREPAFAKAYRLARREAFAQAVALTQRYAPMAVQALAKVMNEKTSPAAARVSAATALLKFSRESIELDELAARIDELEEVSKEFAREKKQ